MKTFFKIFVAIFIIAITIIGNTGCSRAKWTQFDPKESIDNINVLIVPAYNDKVGEELFLDIQNVEPGTTKIISLNGILIGEFQGGDALYGRFTDLIYTLSEKRYDKVWDPVYGARRTIIWLRVVINVDVVEGKSKKRHWSKVFWVSPNSKAHGTVKLEF